MPTEWQTIELTVRSETADELEDRLDTVQRHAKDHSRRECEDLLLVAALTSTGTADVLYDKLENPDWDLEGKLEDGW